MIKLSAHGANHIMNLSPDKKTFVLIEPKRNPASIATKMDEDTDANLMVGKWNWNHDGKNSNNAFIILHPDGKCTAEGGD